MGRRKQSQYEESRFLQAMEFSRELLRGSGIRLDMGEFEGNAGLVYGAFPGPRLPLQVDPEKDIKLHLVLIGGRTTQDLADSQARHRED